MKHFLLSIALAGSGGVALHGDDAVAGDQLPQAPSGDDFDALRKTSPFTRVLSFPETYALRGVATIDNVQVATLYNRETKKTIVVTPDGKNEAGIALVGIIPAATLEGVAAKISFAGDEAELKYELSQIAPQPKPTGTPPGGGTDGRGGDGERRGPSPQDIERFKALPEEKQAKLREYIGHVMKNYPDMPREEKGNLIRGAMIRLTDGRDIEMPSAQGGGQNPPSTQGQNSNSSGGSSSGRDERSGDRGRDRDRR